MAKPKDETLHIKISGELKEELNRAATERDISTAQWVREAIQEKINRPVNTHSLANFESQEAPAV